MSPHALAPRELVRRRRTASGFTLVELTVAMVAGLVVALGIMALSREATRTFHEEVRGAAAEAQLRTAADRLRADLQRAAFMSTANIMADPQIAKSPAATSNVSYIKNAKAMAGLMRLASISYGPNGKPGDSFTLNSLSLSAQQSPALTPDLVEIGGNMTTTEQFEVQNICTQPTGACAAASASCTRILLSPLSGAVYRVGVGSTSASDAMRYLFQPVPSGMTNQFIVRLVDTTGHTQYLATCAGAAPAGLTGSGFTQPYVDIDTSSTPIQSAVSTGTQGGAQGYCVGCSVNPVQIVRWEITSATLEGTNQPQYAAALDNMSTSYGNIDVTKYDLMRTYVDATGAPVYATSELVAEYAVDLKLALSVDTTPLGDQKPTITTLTFDDATNNGNWAYDVSAKNPPPANAGPQRIRSARVLVVTRAALPDRTVNVPLANFGKEEFLYRYCVAPPCLASGAKTNDQTLHWARTRTFTLEVALPNQAKEFY
jgi:hypothetical protein